MGRGIGVGGYGKEGRGWVGMGRRDRGGWVWEGGIGGGYGKKKITTIYLTQQPFKCLSGGHTPIVQLKPHLSRTINIRVTPSDQTSAAEGS
jgi:hypothetical protein